MKRKPLYVLFYIIILFLLSGAVLFLWNAILPQRTNLSKINYWQALGLLVLARILFGGFHFPLPTSIWGGDDQRPLIKDKLMNMNEQDRASFKEEWKKRYESNKE
jgi:hypothetical protein